MRKQILTIIAVVFVALVNIGGCNLFTENADKSSDTAILDDVHNLMDAGLWDDAVRKWYLLSPAGQLVRANKVVLAMAYAGRGGLDIINLATSLSATSSSTRLFVLLMRAFKGKDIRHFYDLKMAEYIILRISSVASERTVDENVFLIFVEFAKIGAHMATLADTNGDGNVDATFTDSCVNANSDDGAYVVTALSNIIASSQATGVSVAGAGLTAIVALCNVIPNACSYYFTEQVPAAVGKFGQSLIGENSTYNIGLNASSVVFPLPCP